MKKIFYFIAIVLFLFTLNSCSDDSNTVTEPKEKYIGATFRFEEGVIWEYEKYNVEWNNFVYFETNMYYTAKYNGEVSGKESFNYHSSTKPGNLLSEPSVLMSTTDDGLYLKFEDAKVFENIFPEVQGKWHKIVDFKNEVWTQFDLQVTENINDTLWVIEYYEFEGEKVSDLEIEFEGETHKATKYRWDYSAVIDSRKPNSFNNSGRVLITILDGIGIYKWDEKDFSTNRDFYRILVDLK